MQFLYDGKFYKAINISGPNHNLLGVEFGDSEEDIDVEALDVKKGDRVLVTTESVIQQVLDGVQEANEELATENFIVRRVQYLPSDSPSIRIYRELAKVIVQRLAAGGEFKRV